MVFRSLEDDFTTKDTKDTKVRMLDQQVQQ
jgi:hypothetical protein